MSVEHRAEAIELFESRAAPRSSMLTKVRLLTSEKSSCASPLRCRTSLNAFPNESRTSILLLRKMER